MAHTTTHRIQVAFGDCDPVGIVFYPNFQRWIDTAALSFFMQCGMPTWRELERERGIVGAPLLEISTRFFTSATYPDELVIHTCVESWQPKVLVQLHRVVRGDTLICEGRETRVFVVRDAENPARIRAIPIPEDIKAMCS